MKFAVAALCIAPALAFAPSSSFGVRRSALDAVATSDVRIKKLFRLVANDGCACTEKRGKGPART